jgi:hypothetical protein
MNFKISFIPDEAYYKEAYFEFTPFKRWEPILSMLPIIFGIGLYCYDHYLRTIPFLFVFIGLYELLKCFYNKNKWIKERLKSAVSGQIIEMEFTDEAIKHTGPFSNGEMKWSGFKAIKKTKKGIVLKIESGISIYLPDKLFNEKEIECIMSKAKPKESSRSDFSEFK